MKVVIALVFCIFVGFCAGSDIWDSAFAGSDAAKLAQLRESVILTRQAVFGDECLVRYWGPVVATTPLLNEHVLAYIQFYCCFFNPSNVNMTIAGSDTLCAYQGFRNGFDDGPFLMEFVHEGLGINDAEFDRYLDIVRLSMEDAGVSDPTAVTDDLETLRASIVDVTGGSCSAADLTLDWETSVDYEETINEGETVKFDWTDDLIHSVFVDSGMISVDGYGANDLTLIRSDSCPAANVNDTACNIDGGNSYSYTVFFPNAGTYVLCCEQHTCNSMRARITVVGDEPSSGNPDGAQDSDDGDDDSEDVDASSSLHSFLF